MPILEISNAGPESPVGAPSRRDADTTANSECAACQLDIAAIQVGPMPLLHKMRLLMQTFRSSLVLSALAALAFILTPVQAQAPGRDLYVANGCYQCHGYEGQGGAALRIAPSPYPFGAFAQLLRRPSNEMPAYSTKVLNDDDLRAIFEYVRSVLDPPAVTDIAVLR